jgi:hypothetical protein
MVGMWQLLVVATILGAAVDAAAQARGGKPGPHTDVPPALPRIAIDPPADFYRSAGSDANFEWYESTVVNASLRIYAFRPFSGDAAAAFPKTLFWDWTPLDFTAAVVGTPQFSKGSMAGADAVLSARYGDANGNSHLRIAIVPRGAPAIALIHLRSATPSGLQQVLPSFNKVFATMRIATGPPRLATGTGADTSAVAGLYLVPRARWTLAGWTGSTYYYLFSADGRVYRGYGLPAAPGGDLRRFDYAMAAQLDPENAGTFEIRGSDLILRLGWQAPSTITARLPDAAGRVTIENSTLTRQVK